MSQFKKLGLSKWLCESLHNMRIEQPTEIQKHCIPEILNGKNCIGGAKTGSGKTIAFAAPMLNGWSKDPQGFYGIVLTPTRELATQIAEQFNALGSIMNIRNAVVVGGTNIIDQSLLLDRKPHFIIATPGRLAHLILNNQSDTNLLNSLKRVKFLVLDEADFLLNETFANDLAVILNHLPKKENRQTLLFTATITDQVNSLQNENYFKYQIEMDHLDNDIAIPKTLSIKYIILPNHVKEAYLYHLLTSEQYEKSSTIVFVNKTITAEILRRTLYALNVRVTSLHSQMPQYERTNSLHRFRDKFARVLVATDIASRGLDIPQVELVINFDIPSDPDTFIHRSGRTARAGRKGDSISFITKRDINRVESIEERINQKLTEFENVHDTAVIKKSLIKVTKAKREALMVMEKENFGERRKIQREKI